VKSQVSLRQVVNTLKAAAKIFEIDHLVNYIPAGLAPPPENTFAAISMVIKKTSTIATPRRYPLEGFLGRVTCDGGYKFATTFVPVYSCTKPEDRHLKLGGWLPKFKESKFSVGDPGRSNSGCAKGPFGQQVRQEGR